ncbi:Hypothetical predicted protein [Paramuricea clavata]|uniref:Uncharacterized protein n=1 Tax=Paramuricea clavata TaxID=317549 RepID=A0A6S7GCR8_PARCT|nr:Hypothetical predicted protein [Paramuricea clavata]
MLPTRDNVTSLLHSVVINSSLKGRSSSTITKQNSSALRDTDHRMLQQKGILEKEYSIVFPSKKLCTDESDVVMLSDYQQIADFKLALKLQQDELESPPDNGPSFQLCTDSPECSNNAECTDSADDENTAATALLFLKSSSKQYE